MEPKMLDKNIHVNNLTGFTIRYVKSETEYFRPHNHNYYEIFLTLKGNINHYVNGKIQHLTAGSLLFIRDFDTHDYATADSESFEFINMSFDKSIAEKMFNYLGDGFDSDALLSAEFPPCVILGRDYERLFYSLMELNAVDDIKISKTKMKVFILEVFTKYFSDFSGQRTDIPLWLEIACEKIKRPENFIAGVERFVKLSGKSREHLSRSLKQHYNITPTEYVTELRLNYAVNLMRTSNLSITEVCYECGFSNLSWFYKIFEKKFGESPARYKKDLQ